MIKELTIEYKLYVFKIFFNGILLAIPFVDVVDVGLKVLSFVSGVILLYFTVVKIKSDLATKKVEREIKELELEKQRSELEEYFRRKHGLK